MHIVYITSEYPEGTKPHGGVGSFVQTLARQIVSKGHKVTVVGIYSIDKEEVSDDNGVIVYRLPRSSAKFARFIGNSKVINQALWKINSSHPIDIIEGAELAFAFIDKKLPCRKVIRMHGGHHFFAVTLGKKPKFWRSWQEKQSFSNATDICAVSNFVGDTTRKLLKLKDREVTVIYNPINIEKFYKADPTLKENGRLLFIGTVCEKKGVRQLILSLEYIIIKYPNVHLDIIGRDWTSPNCPSYIEQLKVELPSELLKHVTFVGAVQNNKIPQRIEKAEVCVYPSHMEAMPIAWLEVLAMGANFIGSQIGPGYEALQDGITGLLCDPYDPKSIADKLIYMLDNPEKAKMMGCAARKDVINRFNVQQLLQQNLDFYQRCIDKL